ncbi:hypothetical protein ACFQ6U_15090 [Streptomyces sp. NPDC056465]|uniref:hypothetical protein n=1 Tax=Streptomyces sp. NPDC056465 TaxID=3345829 RepID=UPI00369B0145
MPSSDSTGSEARDPDAEIVVPGDEDPDEGPSDVFLDVPSLHVDELGLEVDDLEAHVSLQAEVLDLLKLNVGADVKLGRVQLDIEGVDVQAQLKVRLHHIAAVVTRLLATVDRNPQILEQLTRGVGAAVQDVGAGTGRAAGELGAGAGAAVSEVGRGAGTAVESVGSGAGSAVEGVGEKAGTAVGDVGRSAADAVEEAGGIAGDRNTEDEAERARERPVARRRRRAPEGDDTTPDRPRRPAPAKRTSPARKKASGATAPESRRASGRKTVKKTAARKASSAEADVEKEDGVPGSPRTRAVRKAAARPRHSS